MNNSTGKFFTLNYLLKPQACCDLRRAIKMGGKDRPLLWSELMSIASYLAIPTFERLIQTVVVLDEKN